MEKSKITVFYSWQSDLPKDTNQNGIRLSIKSAFPLVESMIDDLDITLDEATSNAPGSPYIPGKIVEKISKADVFICDLTPIGESFDKKKKIANPNVIIELGHAVAELGWDRIIILLNTNYGKVPDDLPFDVDKHRATPFNIVDKSDKNGKNQLTQVLKDAIKTIIEKSPPKPHQKREVNPETLKRSRDIENLKKILNTIHIETFDYFIYEAPSIIVGEIFYYREAFNAVFNASSFHIYDKKLFSLLEKFDENLNEILSYGHAYLSTQITNRYKFQMPDYTSSPENFRKANDELNYLSNLTNTLSSDFKELLTYIRENYIEIDLIETSKFAFDEYLRYRDS